MPTRGSDLGNRCIEAEFATRVILRLQRLEPNLTPLFTAVPHLGALVSVSVVDVGMQLTPASALADNFTEIVAKLGCCQVTGGVGRGISNERCKKHVVASICEGCRAAVDSLHALHRVTLEKEKRVVEWRVSSNAESKEVICFSLSSDVICLHVDGKAWVRASDVLAWWRVEGNSSPCGEVTVCSRCWRAGEGSDVVEWLGVDGVNNGDAFLDNPEQDDGL